MKITREQRIQVAKDRALFDLADLADLNRGNDNTTGYWMMDDKRRVQIQKLASLISLPDNEEATESALGAYIDGNEESYFESKSHCECCCHYGGIDDGGLCKQPCED